MDHPRAQRITLDELELLDSVILPAGAPRGFVNTGSGLLRHVAIHDGAPRTISEPARLDE